MIIIYLTYYICLNIYANEVYDTFNKYLFTTDQIEYMLGKVRGQSINTHIMKSTIQLAPYTINGNLDIET